MTVAAVAQAQKVHPDAPWLGLQTFSEDTREYFFGRAAELTELYQRVLARPLTVLFGRSGLGKSSLIRAGLVPELRQAEWIPVLLRLDHGTGAPSLEAQLLEAVKGAFRHSGFDVESASSLWRLLHDPKYGLCVPGAPQIVLLIDQFEELFTLGGVPERVEYSESLLHLLADIVENRVPESLRDQLRADEELGDRLDFTARCCRIMLAIREDYLHMLERSRAIMPSLMDNRMELRALNGTQALEAAVKPGELRCRNTRLPPIVSDATGRAIVRFLARADASTPIEHIREVSPLLSLLCSELNAARGESSVIRPDQLQGRAEDILENFYKRCLQSHPPAARAFVEDHLLSSDGYRQSANLDSFVHALTAEGVTRSRAESTAACLVNARLLSAEEHGGIQRLELSHDVLAKIAQRSRHDRHEAIRRQRSRRQTLFEIGVACTAVSVVVTFWMIHLYWQTKNALNQVALSERSKASDLFSLGRSQDALAHLARLFELAQKLGLQQYAISAAEQAALGLSAHSMANAAAVMQGHSGALTSAVFSPDMTRALTASNDNTARIWSVATGEQLLKLDKHNATVSRAVFSPDARYVLTASDDNTARIWDSTSGTQLVSLDEHSDIVTSVAFSPVGDLVLTASRDGTARVWSAGAHKSQFQLLGHEDAILSAEFSSDGERVVTTSADSTARIWDVATGSQIADSLAHSDSVTCATFSPDNKEIVTGSSDNLVRLWDVNSGKLTRVLSGHKKRVNSTRFSPNGRFVVSSGDDNTARVWDVRRGEQVAVLAGHWWPLRGASFSPNGRYILTASVDNTARVWDAASGIQLATLVGHSGPVTMASFSADSESVITASVDKTACVWKISSKTPIALLSGHRSVVTKGLFSPDGSHVLTASSDATARLWEVSSGREVLRYSAPSDSALTQSIFSPDGSRFLTVSKDNFVRLWDLKSGRILGEFSGHTANISTCAFNAEGTKILTASDDSTARIWDTETGQQKFELRGHSASVSSATFSPDSKFILTTSRDKSARIWSAESGALLRKLNGHSKGINTGMFSRDGRMVVTSSHDNSARIWDVETGRQLRLFSRHSDIVLSASFSADGKRVLSASADRSAWVWDVASGALGALGAQDALLTGHTDIITNAVFSPDDTLVLTVSNDKSARLWDAKSGTNIAILAVRSGMVTSAAFSPGGDRIITTSDDRSARIWDLLRTSAAPPAWFSILLRTAGRKEFNTNGELIDIAGRRWQDLRTVAREAARRDSSRYGEIARQFFGEPGN